MFKISTTPHINSPVTTQSLMRDVLIALTPAIIVSLLMFGINALRVLLTSVAACVMFEYLITRYLLKAKNTTSDLSAVITGVLLAFNLPSSMPAWMILIGAFVAIGIAKMAFGGLGKNIFNPALVGRVFLFISFPVQMTQWPKPDFLNFMNTDTVTSATTLGILKHIDVSSSASIKASQVSLTELPNYWQMLIGDTGGCIGEVSALALFIGLIYMLLRRVITWHIPFYYVATFFILTAITWFNTDNIHFEPITNILSGGLLLGAFFMATDYVTSPMTRQGQIIFAVGCGILTYIIRFYSAYPEGVSFAILIMNAFVPLIDKFTPQRVYGTKRK